MPTLKILPKDKLIVANPAAAAKIQPLGFSNIMVIDHGQSVDVAGACQARQVLMHVRCANRFNIWQTNRQSDSINRLIQLSHT